MVDLDPTTPQLKVVKQWDHACTSLNIKNIEPILSKDFRFMAFPKIAEHPDLTKEEFIQTYGKMFDSLVKMEVRIQYPIFNAGEPSDSQPNIRRQ